MNIISTGLRRACIRITAAAVLAAVILNGYASVTGTVIRPVTRVDLRQGRISGEKAY